ncbi:transmembrane protein 265 [Scophthalmus maximus]|nr:transmembrane protein 265 [Scophthalmus maximus]XP_035471123.1 transmembrane protein 265 [Scophthalmus maximus]
MSYSPHTSIAMDKSPLKTTPGSADTDTCHRAAGQGLASCCHDEHHRKLAVCSIVCGFSCIGIKALISSVEAEQTEDPETAAKFSRRARRLGIMSIVLWLLFLCLIPVLMALVSYLVTLRD